MSTDTGPALIAGDQHPLDEFSPMPLRPEKLDTRKHEEEGNSKRRVSRKKSAVAFSEESSSKTRRRSSSSRSSRQNSRTAQQPQHALRVVTTDTLTTPQGVGVPDRDAASGREEEFAAFADKAMALAHEPSTPGALKDGMDTGKSSSNKKKSVVTFYKRPSASSKIDSRRSISKQSAMNNNRSHRKSFSPSSSSLVGHGEGIVLLQNRHLVWAVLLKEAKFRLSSLNSLGIWPDAPKKNLTVVQKAFIARGLPKLLDWAEFNRLCDQAQIDINRSRIPQQNITSATTDDQQQQRLKKDKADGSGDQQTRLLDKEKEKKFASGSLRILTVARMQKWCSRSVGRYRDKGLDDLGETMKVSTKNNNSSSSYTTGGAGPHNSKTAAGDSSLRKQAMEYSTPPIRLSCSHPRRSTLRKGHELERSIFEDLWLPALTVYRTLGVANNNPNDASAMEGSIFLSSSSSMSPPGNRNNNQLNKKQISKQSFKQMVKQLHLVLFAVEGAAHEHEREFRFAKRCGLRPGEKFPFLPSIDLELQALEDEEATYDRFLVEQRTMQRKRTAGVSNNTLGVSGNNTFGASTAENSSFFGMASPPSARRSTLSSTPESAERAGSGLGGTSSKLPRSRVMSNASLGSSVVSQFCGGDRRTPPPPQVLADGATRDLRVLSLSSEGAPPNISISIGDVSKDGEFNLGETNSSAAAGLGLRGPDDTTTVSPLVQTETNLFPPSMTTSAEMVAGAPVTCSPSPGVKSGATSFEMTSNSKPPRVPLKESITHTPGTSPVHVEQCDGSSARSPSSPVTALPPRSPTPTKPPLNFIPTPPPAATVVSIPTKPSQSQTVTGSDVKGDDEDDFFARVNTATVNTELENTNNNQNTINHSSSIPFISSTGNFTSSTTTTLRASVGGGGAVSGGGLRSTASGGRPSVFVGNGGAGEKAAFAARRKELTEGTAGSDQAISFAEFYHYWMTVADFFCHTALAAEYSTFFRQLAPLIFPPAKRGGDGAEGLEISVRRRASSIANSSPQRITGKDGAGSAQPLRREPTSPKPPFSPSGFTTGRGRSSSRGGASPQRDTRLGSSLQLGSSFRKSNDDNAAPVGSPKSSSGVAAAAKKAGGESGRRVLRFADSLHQPRVLCNLRKKELRDPTHNKKNNPEGTGGGGFDDDIPLMMQMGLDGGGAGSGSGGLEEEYTALLGAEDSSEEGFRTPSPTYGNGANSTGLPRNEKKQKEEDAKSPRDYRPRSRGCAKLLALVKEIHSDDEKNDDVGSLRSSPSSRVVSKNRRETTKDEEGIFASSSGRASITSCQSDNDDDYDAEEEVHNSQFQPSLREAALQKKATNLVVRSRSLMMKKKGSIKQQRGGSIFGDGTLVGSGSGSFVASAGSPTSFRRTTRSAGSPLASSAPNDVVGSDGVVGIPEFIRSPSGGKVFIHREVEAGGSSEIKSRFLNETPQPETCITVECCLTAHGMEQLQGVVVASADKRQAQTSSPSGDTCSPNYASPSRKGIKKVSGALATQLLRMTHHQGSYWKTSDAILVAKATK